MSEGLAVCHPIETRRALILESPELVAWANTFADARPVDGAWKLGDTVPVRTLEMPGQKLELGFCPIP